jgi:hypothetical protein
MVFVPVPTAAKIPVEEYSVKAVSFPTISIIVEDKPVHVIPSEEYAKVFIPEPVASKYIPEYFIDFP